MQHNRNTYGVRRTPTPKLIDCVLDKTFNRHACFLLPCGAEELEILIKVRTYNPTDAGTAQFGGPSKKWSQNAASFNTCVF